MERPPISTEVHIAIVSHGAHLSGTASARSAATPLNLTWQPRHLPCGVMTRMTWQTSCNRTSCIRARGEIPGNPGPGEVGRDRVEEEELGNHGSDSRGDPQRLS